MWDQFPTFWGRSQTKKLLKADPTLFLAFGGKCFGVHRSSKVKTFFTPKKASMKLFTCNRPLMKQVGVAISCLHHCNLLAKVSFVVLYLTQRQQSLKFALANNM
jgi:hypothetical protein